MEAGGDYYKILQVNREATYEELRNAFRRLALKWHPDKSIQNSVMKEDVEVKFKQISKAYNMLKDPKMHQIYDSDGMNKKDEKSEDIWKQKDDEEGAHERKLALTFEQLYSGCKRKLTILRNVPDEFGKKNTIEEILKIDVKPGWKKGTKIIFPEKGHRELGNNVPADLIFMVDEKPHAFFERQGNDLVLNKKILLVDALAGKTLKVKILDGRELTIQVTDIVEPGYQVVVPNEGMPISKEPGKKGNLRIKFDVMFPSRLTIQQNYGLKMILTS